MFADWPSLVGAEIAARCKPMSLTDGELRIAAESTAWATQLRLLTGKLLARLADRVGPQGRRAHLRQRAGRADLEARPALGAWRPRTARYVRLIGAILSRPASLLQSRGSALPLWLDVLPPLPDDQWRSDLERLAAAMS